MHGRPTIAATMHGSKHVIHWRCIYIYSSMVWRACQHWTVNRCPGLCPSFIVALAYDDVSMQPYSGPSAAAAERTWIATQPHMHALVLIPGRTARGCVDRPGLVCLDWCAAEKIVCLRSLVSARHQPRASAQCRTAGAASACCARADMII